MDEIWLGRDGEVKVAEGRWSVAEARTVGLEEVESEWLKLAGGDGDLRTDTQTEE